MQAFYFIGSSTWARTRDKRINSPLLYQLSYRGITTRTYALLGRPNWKAVCYRFELHRSILNNLYSGKNSDYSIVCLILASAFSRLTISVAKDSRKWPDKPNADPGIRATSAFSSNSCANCTSSSIPSMRSMTA